MNRSPSSSSSSPQEDSPQWMSGLDDDQRVRLNGLLDRYLSRLEEGERLSLSELSLDNEDLIQPLRLYVDQIDRLYGGGSQSNSSSLGAFDALGIEEGGEARRLGDFLLIREIGRGGMGVVYEAIQESLNRKVALKLLPLPSMFSPNQVARFQNEAQAAAILQHPNIVPVYAVGVESGIHFYAMPLIEGQSLDEVVSQLRYSAPPGISTQWLQKAFTASGKLKPLLRLGADAADALQAAHEVGIVHRDIKPSNLLLDTSGQIFVADFGLARMESEKSLTKTGELIGTVRYMSPEQAAGRQALVDHRTDIYSLGVTLYELIALHPAVTGEDGPSLFQAIEKSEPISLRKLRKDVPRDLEVVLNKAMAKRREDRYFTAGEFADDLRRVLEGKPTLAKPPTWSARMAKWTAKNRVYFVAATLILGVTTAASIWLVQKERSTQADMAEFIREFGDAVDELGTKQAESMEEKAGAEESRADILRKVALRYQKIIDKPQVAPVLRPVLAEVNNRLGNAVQLLQSPEEAIVHFRKAESLYELLRKENPNSRILQRGWARNQSDLGLALSETGRLEEGKRMMEQSLQLQRILYKSAPNSLEILDLAKSLKDIGTLYYRIGNRSEARNMLSEGCDLLEHALAVESSDPMDEQRLAISKLAANTKNDLASTYDSEDPVKAVKLYREAIALRTGNREGRVNPSTALAINYNNLATALTHCKEYDEAAKIFGDAITIHRNIVGTSPEVPDYRRQLASSLNNLGNLKMQINELVAARPLFEEAVAIQKEILKELPESIQVESELGGTFNNLALLLAQQGKAQQAAESFVEANRHQRKALEAAPTETRYRDYLSTQYFNFGELQRNQKEWQEAANIVLLRQALYPNDHAKTLLAVKELAELASEAARQNGESNVVRSIAEKGIELIRQAKKIGFKLESAIIEGEPFSILVRYSSIEQLLAP